MFYVMRLCVLIVALGYVFSRTVYGAEETYPFGFCPAEDRGDAIEAVILRPDPEGDEIRVRRRSAAR